MPVPPLRRVLRASVRHAEVNSRRSVSSFGPLDLRAPAEALTEACGTYCGTYGPEDATAGYSEFLDYFMSRKVMCGKETMQAAGTVTKKLAKWLAERGYVKDTQDEQQRAGWAARELPRARKVLE